MSEQSGHFERPTTHKHDFPAIRRAVYLVGVIVIAILSGGVGFALFSTYASIPSNQPISGVRPALPNSTTANYSEAVADVGRYGAALFVSEARHSGTIYDRIPDPALYVAPAVVLTSDGWIVADASSVSPGQDYEVYFGGRFHNIADDRFDAFTGLYFAQLAEVAGLSPVDFSNLGNAPGTPVFYSGLGFEIGFSFGSGFILNANERYNRKIDYVVTTATLNDLITVDAARGEAGTAFFDLHGRLVGIARESGAPVTLVPARHIRLAFEQMLSESAYLDLGLWYVDDASLPDLAPASTADRGAAIYHPSRTPVSPRSVASDAGFREEDRILEINGEPIASSHDVQYVWRRHQNDPILQFVVLRDGEVVSLTIER